VKRFSSRRERKMAYQLRGAAHAINLDQLNDFPTRESRLEAARLWVNANVPKQDREAELKDLEDTIE